VPCGHERVFQPPNIEREDYVWPSNVPGESSWLGAPYIKYLPKGALVLHQVREPVAVIRSFLRIRFFETPSPYLKFAQRCQPDLSQGEAIERCMKYWLGWNRLAELGAHIEGLRYFRYRLEDIDAVLLQQILAMIGYDCDPERVARAVDQRPRDYNTRGTKQYDGAVRWEMLPGGRLLDAMVELAARYGYRRDGIP
jgi:hypothetical protein